MRVVLVGPPATTRPATSAALVPGLHGDHPPMGTTTNRTDNLEMTTDLRHLYQSVLQSWLASPDPLYTKALPGLFVDGSCGSAGGHRNRRGTVISSKTLDRAATSSTALDRVHGRPGAKVAGETALPTVERYGRAVHPVSLFAALAFNAFVAAIVVRSGRFREALAEWRDSVD